MAHKISCRRYNSILAIYDVAKKMNTSNLKVPCLNVLKNHILFIPRGLNACFMQFASNISCYKVFVFRVTISTVPIKNLQYLFSNQYLHP